MRPVNMRERPTHVGCAGTSSAGRWWCAAAWLVALGGAVWVAVPYFKSERSPVSQKILFLCLLGLILYELTKAGRGGRGG